MRRTSFHLRLCGFVSFVMVVFAILYRVKIQSKTFRFASVVCTMYVRGHCGSIRVLCIFKWIISLLLSIIKFIAVPTRYSRAQWIGAHLQWISSIHGQQIATLTMRSMMSVWERCEIGRQTSGKNALRNALWWFVHFLISYFRNNNNTKKNSKTDVHRLTIECTEKFLRVSNFHKSNDDSRILLF